MFSGPALWPLLAVLLGAADECGDYEQLGSTVGIGEGDPLVHTGFLLGLLEKSSEVNVSVGMWHRADIEIDAEGMEHFPDQMTCAPFEPEEVRCWVSERTGGVVDVFRRELNRHSPLVMMSALTVRSTWAVPFVDIDHIPASGPWSGRPLAALRRLGSNTSTVWSTENVTCALVVGNDDVNVLLVVGKPDDTPAFVLISGFETLVAGPSDLGIGYTGPCVTVEVTDSASDVVEFIVPRFTVRAEHDLLRMEELSEDWFGEYSAYHDQDEAHDDLTEDDFDEYGQPLPLLSEQELVLGEARQIVVGSFTATGFGLEGAPPPPENVTPPTVERPRKITVCLDRPFGFFAVQKSTELVLGAGWVADPEYR